MRLGAEIRSNLRNGAVTARVAFVEALQAGRSVISQASTSIGRSISQSFSVVRDRISTVRRNVYSDFQDASQQTSVWLGLDGAISPSNAPSKSTQVIR